MNVQPVMLILMIEIVSHRKRALAFGQLNIKAGASTVKSTGANGCLLAVSFELYHFCAFVFQYALGRRALKYFTDLVFVFRQQD